MNEGMPIYRSYENQNQNVLMEKGNIITSLNGKILRNGHLF